MVLLDELDLYELSSVDIDGSYIDYIKLEKKHFFARERDPDPGIS